MSRQEHSQTCGIDELELLEVKNHHRSLSHSGAFDLALQQWRICQVKFSRKAQDEPVLFDTEINLQLILGSHRLMLAHRLAVRAS